jgi:hypothetical protein
VGFRSRFRFFVVMIALSALSVITPTQTFAPFSEPPADGEISLETAAKRSFEFLHKIGHVITSKAYIGCLEPMARHRVWTIQDTARSFVIMVDSETGIVEFYRNSKQIDDQNRKSHKSIERYFSSTIAGRAHVAGLAAKLGYASTTRVEAQIIESQAVRDINRSGSLSAQISTSHGRLLARLEFDLEDGALILYSRSHDQ